MIETILGTTAPLLMLSYAGLGAAIVADALARRRPEKWVATLATLELG